MATAGWALAEEFVTGPVALLSFTNESGTVQITLTFDQGTGSVDVGIIDLG